MDEIIELFNKPQTAAVKRKLNNLASAEILKQLIEHEKFYIVDYLMKLNSDLRKYILLFAIEYDKIMWVQSKKWLHGDLSYVLENCSSINDAIKIVNLKLISPYGCFEHLCKGSNLELIYEFYKLYDIQDFPENTDIKHVIDIFIALNLPIKVDNRIDTIFSMCDCTLLKKLLDYNPEIFDNITMETALVYSYDTESIKFILSKFTIDKQKYFNEALLNDAENINEIYELIKNYITLELDDIFIEICESDLYNSYTFLAQHNPNYYINYDEDYGLESYYIKNQNLLLVIGTKQTDDITCLICHELVAKVITECNHTYCKDCLNQWYSGHSNCPYCRQAIASVAEIEKI